MKKNLFLIIWLWIGLISVNQKRKTNFSFECFLKKFNPSNQVQTKPWITPGLQKSISVKNKLLKKFIKLKEPSLKNEAHTK